MPGFWLRELAKYSIFVAIALVIEKFEGWVPALIFLCLALLLGNVFHLRNLNHLTLWLTRTGGQLVPEVSGSWQELSAALYRLVRTTKLSQSQLNLALDRFQQAAAAMTDGFIILDEHGGIEWCNPVAQRHFSLNPEVDRGTDITYFVRQPEFALYVESQDYNEPLIMRGARSQDLVLAVQLIPYGNAQKLIVSRDITQWERAESARRDFVANVSHEMRTPITVLSGFLETLSDMKTIEPKLLTRSMSLMQSETKRMQHLVEDLLMLAQLENGPAMIDSDTVDVVALVAELIREARILSSGKHDIQAQLRSDARLHGNLHEIRSAFGNLVSNAVRYTPEGGSVALSWSMENGLPIFVVTDTGPGIEAKHIPRLTERFYRVDRSRSRASGGTGLGLAIVKHILNRHQARLEISSEVGKGSRFAAVFPAERLVAAELAAIAG
jgi:two-component system, OmpR family, phosphate regulon sensor histidine kinase PhoR